MRINRSVQFSAAEEPVTTLIEMKDDGFSCALYGCLDGGVSIFCGFFGSGDSLRLSSS